MRFYVDSDPSFERSAKHISAITNAMEATVTTTTDHKYGDGDIVRLLVPRSFGMNQADKLKGEITVTGAKTFTIKVDTTKFDLFAVPAPVPWYVNATAQVLPVGEISANLSGATQNVL